jgi:hypothetical protein
VYIESIPINITFCTFTSNTAASGLGNDIYVLSSVTYPSDYTSDSCSTSEEPTVTVGTSDQSSLLGPCVNFSTAYLSSSSNFPAGVDSNGVCCYDFD